MLDSVKRYWEENQLPIVATALTGVAVVVGYNYGFRAGTFVTAKKLLVAANEDYEFMGNFLLEKDLMNEFNELLAKRGSKEGMLRFLKAVEEGKELVLAGKDL